VARCGQRHKEADHEHPCLNQHSRLLIEPGVHVVEVGLGFLVACEEALGLPPEKVLAPVHVFAEEISDAKTPRDQPRTKTRVWLQVARQQDVDAHQQRQQQHEGDGMFIDAGVG